MALDWSKNISFAGLRKKAPKAKAVYPTKTYINLVVEDKKKLELRSMLPKAILVVLIAVVAIKFGVIDFYGRVAQKEAELGQQTSVLNDLEAQLVNYDSIKAEYETYESTKLVADGIIVPAVDALKLVDRFITPVAQVDSINLQGNTMTLKLSNITLNGVGKLVSTLNAQPIVANVSVSTAATNKDDKSQNTTAAMTIALQVAV